MYVWVVKIENKRTCIFQETKTFTLQGVVTDTKHLVIVVLGVKI